MGSPGAGGEPPGMKTAEVAGKRESSGAEFLMIEARYSCATSSQTARVGALQRKTERTAERRTEAPKPLAAWRMAGAMTVGRESVP